MCRDAAGNVCVTGRDNCDDPPEDWITIKHAPDGDTLWVAISAGPADEEDEPDAIAADEAGCVCVT